MAIFCNANPECSGEIWQYVYVINKAASSFNWSNVMEYDVIFRQMMALNLKRSWAKTYTQMWNICLTEPIRHGYDSNSWGGKRGTPSSAPAACGSGLPSHKVARQAKPDYCWKFNKGKCKFGSECKFVNRCSYCDSAAHGQNTCPKKGASSGAANSS